MNIIIDTQSPVSVYKQIVFQIKGLIASGELLEGTKLPSIRDLAYVLGVANNTMARAYYELEESGYISLNGRRGSIVNKRKYIDDGEKKVFLQQLTEEYLLRTKEHFFSVDEIISEIKEKYNEIYS